jgi:adenine-specific DNA glycosylase
METLYNCATPKKGSRKNQKIRALWIETDRGLVLEQRALDGLWAGLWEPPSASGAGAKRELAARLGRPLGARIATVTHDLTHRHVQASIYQAATTQPLGRAWPTPLTAPLSALGRKAILAVTSARER